MITEIPPVKKFIRTWGVIPALILLCFYWFFSFSALINLYLVTASWYILTYIYWIDWFYKRRKLDLIMFIIGLMIIIFSPIFFVTSQDTIIELKVKIQNETR